MLARFSVDTFSIPAQVVYFQLNIDLGTHIRPLLARCTCTTFLQQRVILDAYAVSIGVVAAAKLTLTLSLTESKDRNQFSESRMLAMVNQPTGSMEPEVNP
jgi:hypothetical protein